ncbi:MAG: hypothetical protein CK424_03995 [Legionella sp.]|nr:MAG: hypothetical protein CK424_03995 [Legionella sp.]
MTQFFKNLSQHYADTATAYIIQQLQDRDHQWVTTHAEVNLILVLIGKLRTDYAKNTIFTKAILEEMLKGGHIQFEDDGAFYEELLLNFKEHLQTRSSSHQSCKQQYSFSGPVVKELLMGVSNKNGRKTTWIQLEKNNTKTIIDFILHIIDYLQYKLTGKNIGPYGSSKHTDQNPLIIAFDQQDSHYSMR